MTNTPLPSFTIVVKIGLDGLDEEVEERLTVAFDPELSDEQNMAVIGANAQLAQVRMQVALQKMLTVSGPALIKRLATEQGIDLPPDFFD